MFHQKLFFRDFRSVQGFANPGQFVAGTSVSLFHKTLVVFHSTPKQHHKLILIPLFYFTIVTNTGYVAKNSLGNLRNDDGYDYDNSTKQ